jgi:hypothetical protein
MKKLLSTSLLLLIAAPAIADDPNPELLPDPNLNCFMMSNLASVINLNQMCNRTAPKPTIAKPPRSIAASPTPNTELKIGIVEPIGTPKIAQAALGYWQVSCPIKNNTNQPVNSVLVTFSVESDVNGVVDTNSTYIQPMVIPAGESGTLEMLVKESGKVQILAVEWQWSDDTPGVFQPPKP